MAAAATGGEPELELEPPPAPVRVLDLLPERDEFLDDALPLRPAFGDVLGVSAFVVSTFGPDASPGVGVRGLGCILCGFEEESLSSRCSGISILTPWEKQAIEAWNTRGDERNLGYWTRDFSRGDLIK